MGSNSGLPYQTGAMTDGSCTPQDGRCGICRTGSAGPLPTHGPNTNTCLQGGTDIPDTGHHPPRWAVCTPPGP